MFTVDTDIKELQKNTMETLYENLKSHLWEN